MQSLTEKQEKDLDHHNKKKTKRKIYESNDVVFVRNNKRIGNKLTPRYKIEKVKEDRGGTILTTSNRVVHKNLIKN